jgi:PAS domain S-box-containing protein
MNSKTKTSDDGCSSELLCSGKPDHDAVIGDGDLSGLLTAINVAVVIIDANFRVRYFSPATPKFLGIASIELGHPLGKLAGKIGAESMMSDAREVREGFGVREEEFKGAHGRVWLRRIQPYRIIHNRIDRIVISFTDITDRKRVEELLRDQDESKIRFLTDISHELRTPLAAILLWSKLLAEPNELRKNELSEGLQAIKKCVEEQQALIDGFVELSRMAAGNLQLEKNDIELASIIHAAVSAVKLSATAKGVIVEEHYDQAVGTARADPQRLHQVIWNLLTNAVKFTGPGGWIGVRVNRYGDDVEVRIADSGQGIDVTVVPHIFERLRTAEGANTIGKCGLTTGLYTARRLVELHDGTITADSAGPGLGATFLVRLPLPEIVKKNAAKKRISNDIDLATRRAVAVNNAAQTIKINEHFYYNGKVA